MEELNLLEKLGRVKAPPDFEQKVLSLLSERKEKKRLRMRNLGFSFAGAFAVLLVCFIVLNIFVFRGKRPLDFSSLERKVPAGAKRGETLRARDYLPIIEAVEYSEELQRPSNESQTIYILEQVSEEVLEQIKY